MLPLLQSVDVHDNQIVTIDEAIGELGELRFLNLGYQITFFAGK
jgi:Leucine-rich repeat (LRR) protein